MDKKSKPPTLKPLTLLEATQRGLKAAQDEFENKPWECKSEWQIKKFRKDFIRKSLAEWEAQIEAQKKEFLSHFQEELFEREKTWPRDWMRNDVEINNRLEGTIFNQIMNHLWDSASRKMTEEMQKFVPEDKWRKKVIIKGKPQERELVLLSVDPVSLADSLDRAERLIRQYLYRLIEMGVLLRVLDGRGSDRPTVYAIGYWSIYIKKDEDGNTSANERRNAFLVKSNKEMLEKLRSFTVR